MCCARLIHVRTEGSGEMLHIEKYVNFPSLSHKGYGAESVVCMELNQALRGCFHAICHRKSTSIMAVKGKWKERERQEELEVVFEENVWVHINILLGDSSFVSFPL